MNAMKLYHKDQGESEKIRYYNFTRLYPTVQCTKHYPIGHPNFDRVKNDFGFKCTVLFHPVLPYKCHNKLMFPLCRTCAEEQNQHSDCVHGDSCRVHGCPLNLEKQYHCLHQ